MYSGLNSRILSKTLAWWEASTVTSSRQDNKKHTLIKIRKKWRPRRHSPNHPRLQAVKSTSTANEQAHCLTVPGTTRSVFLTQVRAVGTRPVAPALPKAKDHGAPRVLTRPNAQKKTHSAPAVQAPGREASQSPAAESPSRPRQPRKQVGGESARRAAGCARPGARPTLGCGGRRYRRPAPHDPRRRAKLATATRDPARN